MTVALRGGVSNDGAVQVNDTDIIALTATGAGPATGKTLEATSGPNGSALSHRNKIINGSFPINQRGYVSGAAVGAGLYGHDRWKMAASGDTYTYSTTANKTTITIPATKVLRQVIEGLNLQTGTYVLSWEGTAQGKIGAGSLGASGITGSITGGTDTTIEFGPGTVANVQLEAGSIATPFEHRPYGLEENLCKKYCRSYTAAVIGHAITSQRTYSDGAVPLGDGMRVFPTLRAGATYTASTGSSGTSAILQGDKNIVGLYNSAANWTVGAAITFTGIFESEL